jgi:hypothetical protein
LARPIFRLVMSTWFTSYGYAEVYPDLLVGALPLDADDVLTLRGLRVERVLNLVEDSEYQPGDRAVLRDAYARAGIEEARLSLVDFGRLPAERIEEGVSIIVAWLQDGRRSYVHCRAGWQRSASLAAAAIAVREQLGIREALRYVQARKPTADPLPHQRNDLEIWFADRVVR